ncbi:MAG: ATP-binding cassette domain-containing protein [bacterium]|nr:ATP-binding cassette domain-containing protein [bacterium]
MNTENTNGSDSNEVLIESCELIFKHLGVAIKLPLTKEEMSNNVEDNIELLARNSGISFQRIKLQSNWCSKIVGPLLCFKNDNESVAAVIPYKNRSYIAYDFGHKSSYKLTSKTAANLQGDAFVFFRPLEIDKYSIFNLFRWSVQGFRSEIFAIFIVAALIGFLSLAFPLSAQLLFDQAMPTASFYLLLIFCGGLFVAGLASLFLRVSLTVLVSRVWGQALNNLQIALMDKLLRMPMIFYQNYDQNELAYLSTGIDKIGDYLDGKTIVSLFVVVFSIFNVGLLFVYDVRLALVSCAFITCYVLAISLIYYMYVNKLKKSSRLSWQISSQVYETLNGIVKLRVSGAEQRFFERWALQLNELIKISVKVEKLKSYTSILSWVYKFIILACMFYILSRQSNLNFSIGKLVGFSVALFSYMLGLIYFVDNILSFIKARTLITGMLPILKESAESSSDKIDMSLVKGDIEVQQVSFHYPKNSRQILFDINLKVNAGDFVALVGPSGSGKTTLLSLLIGFVSPVEGNIYYDGHDSFALNLASLRNQFGVVKQNGQLFPGSILENITVSRLVSPEEMDRVVTISGLKSFIDSLPMGLETIVNNSTGASGGQKQRVLIARALVGSPKIIFMDEATSALDNDTQKVIDENFAKLKITRVVVAHRLSTIRKADRIYVLDKGHLVQSGKYDELASVEGIFFDMVKRQQL